MTTVAEALAFMGWEPIPIATHEYQWFRQWKEGWFDKQGDSTWQEDIRWARLVL